MVEVNLEQEVNTEEHDASENLEAGRSSNHHFKWLWANHEYEELQENIQFRIWLNVTCPFPALSVFLLLPK